MRTYALLGATGGTGSAILRCLLSQPPESLTLNIFVRSESKLRKSFPDLESTTAFKAKIIEGIPSDSTAMRECLKDADVVMACIASNESKRGMSLIFDTATAIIDALKWNRETRGSAYKTPTVIQLRSASLNPTLSAAAPWIARKVAGFCFHYIYEDLDRACKLFASSAADTPGLLDYIFVDPPSIHDADGTTPTGYKLILDEKQEGALSYADLGAAFCEVAERKDEFFGKGVGVTATGTVNMTWGTLQGYMATGVKSRIWG
jgi:oxidoreductase AflX